MLVQWICVRTKDVVKQAATKQKVTHWTVIAKTLLVFTVFLFLFEIASRYEHGQELAKKQQKLRQPRLGSKWVNLTDSKHVDVMKMLYLVLPEGNWRLDMSFETQIRMISKYQSQTNTRVQCRLARFRLLTSCRFFKGYTKLKVGSKTLTANRQLAQIVQCYKEEEKLTDMRDFVKDFVGKEHSPFEFLQHQKKPKELRSTLFQNKSKVNCIHGITNNETRGCSEAVFRQSGSLLSAPDAVDRSNETRSCSEAVFRQSSSFISAPDAVARNFDESI